MLIVEDDDDTREMIKQVMTRSGRVDAVSSAAEARRRLRLHDVLCTDMNLGGGQASGLELAREFKRCNPHGYVILLTGSDCVKPAWVDKVLRKPVFVDTLLAVAKAARPKLNLFDRAMAAMEASEETVTRTRSLLFESRVLLQHAHPA